MKIKALLLSLLLGPFSFFHAQKQGQERIDSLISLIPINIEDTNKVKLLGDISSNYWSINPQEGIVYGKQALELAQKLNWKKGMASALGRIGINYGALFDPPKALEYHFKSLKINEELGNKKAIAGNLNNIGNVYLGLLDYPVALNYYKRALKINEEIGNKNWAARNYGNIGNIYWRQKKFKVALDNYFKSIKFFEDLGDLSQMALNYGNIGNVYNDQRDFEQALHCYFKAINFQRITGDEILKTINFGNIAGTYMAIAMDSNGTHLKKLFANNKKEVLLKAKNYLDSAIQISIELDLLNALSENYDRKSTVWSLLGDDKAALESYKLSTKFKDSIFTMEKSKKLTETAMQFEFDKKEAITKVEQQKKDLVQSNIRSSILLGLGVTLLFLVAVYRQGKKVKSEKKEVEKQKLLVDEKNKEILESITYAKRIQFTFLAHQELLEQNLKDYFIFFKPKDIVSGDFYWAGNLKNGNFAIVTADSTGHGVPGAIMSLLNITSIESALNDGLTSPAEILNDTRKTIIERLKKDGSLEGGKDGMDASLISFDFKNNKLTYSAANNPIWIVRQIKTGTQEGEIATNKAELIELKPDKMPVGKHDKDKTPFTQHDFILQKNDVVYTLTDGLPDQFGGPQGKKFKHKKLKELLVSISTEPMESQNKRLEEALESWKGELEQVDDITLIGMRI